MMSQRLKTRLVSKQKKLIKKINKVQVGSLNSSLSSV